MSRPRLLHILEATTAGVRRYVTALARAMRTECDVEVACPAIRQAHFGDTAFVDDMQRLGVRVHALPLRRSIGPRDVAAYRALTGVLRAGRYDVIHTHSSKAGFLGRLAARRLGVPVAHTPNGLYFLEQPGLKRQFYLTLERLAGAWSTRLVAVSPGERRVMMRYRLAAPDRIVLIENGVDAAQVRAGTDSPEADDLRRALGLIGEGPLIGGAGRMISQKNPLAFVQMAWRVRQAIPAARFAWCGDGELRPAVEALARTLGVPLRVTGHLENVWAAMRAFDVFVLPSLYEGLPFALLEAMALRVPAVATDVAGTRDVLEGQSVGWLVEPRNDLALANAVIDVLARPDEVRRRVDAAAQLVTTRFSLERMIDAHRALYAGMLRVRDGSAAPARIVDQKTHAEP